MVDKPQVSHTTRVVSATITINGVHGQEVNDLELGSFHLFELSTKVDFAVTGFALMREPVSSFVVVVGLKP